MCEPCSKRRQGRIVPVNPSNNRPTRSGQDNGASQKGGVFRDKLRYTGR